MKRVDNFLDLYIGHHIQKADEHERLNHKSSGKLSASGLGSPLQWQILKSFGVPERTHDEYTLRKFKRGKDVEEWYLSIIPGVLGKQEFVQYRDTVGYMDGWVDTMQWNFPLGEMPLEIKSVANAKYKRITSFGGPDAGHKLQSGLYALARAAEHFAISYIATDDYRVQTYILDTADVRDDIERIIDAYQAQKATGRVPVFEAREKWQADVKYCNYPDWVGLTQEECDRKLDAFLAANV